VPRPERSTTKSVLSSPKVQRRRRFTSFTASSLASLKSSCAIIIIININITAIKTAL
jgi:hypothetical protein